jgi:hypothetical protein
MTNHLPSLCQTFEIEMLTVWIVCAEREEIALIKRLVSVGAILQSVIIKAPTITSTSNLAAQPTNSESQSSYSYSAFLHLNK